MGTEAQIERNDLDQRASGITLTPFNPRYAHMRGKTRFNTRAPLGGGGEYRPLPDFLDSSKRRQMSTLNLQFLPQHQFDVCHQNCRKIRREIFEKMAY